MKMCPMLLLFSFVLEKGMIFPTQVSFLQSPLKNPCNFLNYWLYTLGCTVYPCSLFYTEEFVPLNPLKIPVIFNGLLVLFKSESQNYKLGLGGNIGIWLLCLSEFRKKIHWLLHFTLSSLSKLLTLVWLLLELGFFWLQVTKTPGAGLN